MTTTYDTIIIGAGMSGIAAGIRLAHFGKKVIILERHSIAGGLNSYYKRHGDIYDVGLHAMTNFSVRKNKRAPLNKLLRQLRLNWDDLDLVEQKQSIIKFPHISLEFSNDIEQLKQEIREKFPSEIQGFLKLVEYIQIYDALSLENNEYCSARKTLRTYIKNDLLIEMLVCPLMYYGSAWENDMDFSQFAIMFNSIFLEGFCRPKYGVTTIIDLLKNKYMECGGQLQFNAAVSAIETISDKVTGVRLQNGECIYAKNILSSAGICETYNLVNPDIEYTEKPGSLSFTEVILKMNTPVSSYGYEHTIMFYNNSHIFSYEQPHEFVSLDNGVICCPDNFDYEQRSSVMPVVRLTNMANNRLWASLSKAEYNEKKLEWFKKIINNTSNIIPLKKEDIIFHDMFTPKTVERYTGHINGAVYGSINKIKNGCTKIDNLYVCGTDQGFLGIIGSILSGISIANMYLLK